MPNLRGMRKPIRNRILALFLILSVLAVGGCGTADPQVEAAVLPASTSRAVQLPPGREGGRLDGQIAALPTALPTTHTPLPATTPEPSPTPRPSPTRPVGGGTGWIAFSSHRDGVSQIYLTGAGGGDVIRLTDDPNRLSKPVWSPDGSRIAMVLIEPGGVNLELVIMNADGTGLRRLTHHIAVDTDPAWSPDGTRIAFTTNRDTPISVYRGPRFAPRTIFEIYVLDLDGSNLVRLTQNRDWDTSPSWSPDGRQIAFQSNRKGNSEIYVMNADGSGQRNLTRHPADDASPSWSPDGTKIAFHSDRDGDENFEIYVMDADGSNQKRLTHYPGWDINPAWSPDGQYLCFYRDHAYNFEIYMMRADGTGLARLTHHLAFDGFASWQP